MRILVVDDEEIIRLLAVRILSKAGYEVQTAANGAQAIEELEADVDRIRLAIVDQKMAGPSGVETIRRLRLLKADLPCIVSSGGQFALSDLPDELTVRTHLLGKPYRPADLIEVVRIALTDRDSK